ncbi:uncharacterized protein LOC129971927 [Argiope bruennichi]|uniref:uncharacterized protein LOC129971927 n=1 Tax=Argiope bruennichi TaxID=94029 RepID=UPI00249490D0|nr:uncharacterized protein LOC129971927 [Argiope bruennichi]
MGCEQSATRLTGNSSHNLMAPFISWNCRGIRTKLEDLKALVNSTHPVCIALQDTFLKSNVHLKIRGYNCVRKDNVTGLSSGGVCILTSNSYPSTILNLHTPLQAVAVQVHVKTLVTVCCIYLPPNDVIPQNDLNVLIDQLPVPFILLGDFNGHSTLWGSDRTNSRTFHSVDLALCTPALFPLLNFIVASDLYNSDHFPLIVSHADENNATQQYPQTYIFQRADWGTFTRKAVITEEMVTPTSITNSVQNVIDCIIGAANATIPKRSSFPRKYHKPWWNDACREAYRDQKRLWGIFRRYPTTENLIAFKKARANARRIRRLSQRASWIRYVSSITSTTSSAQVWRKVREANGIYKDFTFPVLSVGSLSYSSPFEIANIMGQTFADISSSAFWNPVFLTKKRRAEQLKLKFETRGCFLYNCEFRMYELKKALSRTRDTNPGVDGITYSMLRHLDESSLLSPSSL